MWALKRIGVVMLGLWCLLLATAACDPRPGRSQATGAQSQMRTLEARSTSDTRKKESEPVWPFTGKDEERLDLADNLIARNFVVIFDGSGSMSQSKCSGSRTKSEVAKDAFAQWSDSVPSDANVGLVSFNRGGWSQLPMARYGKQARESFLTVIKGIDPGGSTPLAEAITRAYEMLTPQARKQLGYGEYIIVVVTDGIADDPIKLVKVVDDVLKGTPIVIHTIGFCIGQKHSLNQAGRTYYRAANDPAALRKGLQEVLAEAETFDVSGFGR